MKDVPYIILAVSIYVAAVIDYKTRTIPIFLFPISGIIFTVSYLLINGTFSFLNGLIAAVIGILSFLALALFFDGGGGDIIMMATIGWCVGIKTFIYIVIISCIINNIVVIYLKTRKKQSITKTTVPFAPSVALSFTTVWMIGFIRCFT